MGRVRIGVDIGGTFTDVVVADDAGELVYVGKHPSRSAAAAMLEGVEHALHVSGAAPEDVEVVVHATTLGANALLEHKGARIALITTAGFRDVLELGRGRRPSLYDLQFDKLEPLVPRERRLEVDERLRHDGSVERALDEASVRRLVPLLRELRVDAIAVCLLHAYANPAHENAVARILAEALPGQRVLLSHRVLAEAGEYERTTATVVCATLAPLFEGYLGDVVRGLDARGIDAQLYIMHSGGGVMWPADVALRAHTLVESGPAAGVLAATQLIARQPGGGDTPFVSFDMGGTTAKGCIIVGGEAAVTTQYELGRGSHGSPAVKFSGYPIMSPVVDLIETGRGGGSLAWVDAAGVLRIGPGSAGAVPGPACYGRGGELPTVTDCNLVLGRLSAAGFAGGTMELDVERAREAIARHLSERLGTSVEETAAAVIRVANAAMARSLRVIAIHRGIDPRSLTLIAFGGGGPVHAAELGMELGIRSVLVPPQPGVFSALGLVSSEATMDFSQACAIPCREEGAEALAQTLRALRARAERWFHDATDAHDGSRPSEWTLAFHADVRYEGQSHALALRIEDAWSGPALTTSLRDAFDRAHLARYSFDYAGSPAEIVVCRASARIAFNRVVHEAARGPGPAARGRATEAERAVYFPDAGFLPALLVARDQLVPGREVRGPAVVEEATSSLLVPPGGACTARSDGTLALELPSATVTTDISGERRVTL